MREQRGREGVVVGSGGIFGVGGIRVDAEDVGGGIRIDVDAVGDGVGIGVDDVDGGVSWVSVLVLAWWCWVLGLVLVLGEALS